MKKIITLMCTLLALQLTSYAQENVSVTKFLGIPIDGTRYEMLQKLKAKGFTNAGDYSNADLIGEFNGHDVEISAVTNNNKVYRIAVFDRFYSDEADIKIRFNTLCQQFGNNPKYRALSENQSISAEEDISYEMSVNSKRYQAVFYQHTDERAKYPKSVDEYLMTIFTQEQIDNPTEEEVDQISKMRSEFLQVSLSDLITIESRTVWFMIDNSFGRYRILMFYDNGLNQSNGEDL